MKQELMRWQWHLLDHMQITCTSFQTGNHASTTSLNFFTGWMLFLMPNQQCPSTECKQILHVHSNINYYIIFRLKLLWDNQEKNYYTATSFDQNRIRLPCLVSFAA